MAFNEHLADRIRRVFQEKRAAFEEKKMMGGLCFLVDGKMCVGIVEDKLMTRIDPAIYEAALTKKGCSEMNFTGRPMKGYVFVQPEGIDADAELSDWVQLCLDFNPRAKSSRKVAK